MSDKQIILIGLLVVAFIAFLVIVNLLVILSIKLDTLTARILKLSSDSHSRIESAPLYSRRYPADR